MRIYNTLYKLRFPALVMLGTAVIGVPVIMAHADPVGHNTDYVGFKQSIMTVSFVKGYRSQVTKAEPILAKYNIPGTYYVPVDAAIASNGKGYISLNDLKFLRDSGYELGNSTESNQPFDSTSAEPYVRYSQAQAWFQNTLQVTPKTCAYPSGTYNNVAVAAAMDPRLSFMGCVSGDQGIDFHQRFNKWKIKSVPVDRNITAQNLEDLINNVSTNLTWLNLQFIQIDDEKSQSDPLTTSQIMDWAMHIADLRRGDSTMKITTVSGALQLIQQESLTPTH